jgi:hypothetical protein
MGPANGPFQPVGGRVGRSGASQRLGRHARHGAALACRAASTLSIVILRIGI